MLPLAQMAKHAALATSACVLAAAALLQPAGALAAEAAEAGGSKLGDVVPVYFGGLLCLFCYQEHGAAGQLL